MKKQTTEIAIAPTKEIGGISSCLSLSVSLPEQLFLSLTAPGAAQINKRFCSEKSLTSRMNYAIKKDANNGAMTSVIQRGVVGFDSWIWLSSCLVAFLGVLTAAYSQEPLFWLLAWPVPLALVSTIFSFIRQGFHFQNGLFVLGRRKG